MYFLRLFLMAWFLFGIVSASFLFWLCKRTTPADREGSKLISFPDQRTEFSSRSTPSIQHRVF